MFQYILLSLFVISHALPTPTGIFLADPDASETNPDTMEVVQVGSQLFFRDTDGTLISLDSEAPVEKKREKIANPVVKIPKKGKEFKQPAPAFAFEEPKDYDFMSQQPGDAPKLSGAFVNYRPPEDMTSFNFREGAGAVTNPAATYLEGGNFDNVAAPKCEMAGCVGPMPNDGSFSLTGDNSNTEACFQTFVPLNGCTDGKGYPMGMLCTICCDCTKDFISEMKKTRGYKTGYKP